ncbi:hypothetical protein [Eisenbergiella tayi]|uniref:hypothetical protein n=1 Tax=Eisenbergiella tayi TaxID=1432052 RepID=UPI00114D2121|nr:hypothetical protein [Eisenbergiella tayi]
MKEITVMKVKEKDLSSEKIIIYSLKGEPHPFTVMYSMEKNILCVNGRIPEADIKKFLQIVEYKRPDLLDQESRVYEITRYVEDTYGRNTLLTLWEFQSKRRVERGREETLEKTKAVCQMIRAYQEREDSPNMESELGGIIHNLSGIGNAIAWEEKKRCRTIPERAVSLSDEFIFLYGYLMGMGVITEDNVCTWEYGKAEYIRVFPYYFRKMTLKQLKKLHYYANSIFCRGK